MRTSQVKSLQEAGEIETGDVRIFQVSHVGGHKVSYPCFCCLAHWPFFVRSLLCGSALPSIHQLLPCLRLLAWQYAGNVIVHGALSVCDGEWYGGLRASDAKQFLHEILTLSVSRNVNECVIGVAQ